MNPKVSIIILNRNGWQDTLECLESVFRIDYPCYDIILVDNFSTDNSLDYIDKWLKGETKITSKFYGDIPCSHKVDILGEPIFVNNKELVILKNNANLGFSGGNNVALNRILNNKTESEYVLFLNNDTVVKESFLDELIKIGLKSPLLGCVASKNMFYDYPDTIRYAGGKINRFFGQIKHIGLNQKDSKTYQEIYETDFGVGSSLLVKSSILKEIGGFDEKFFAYGEDVDLCLRIQSKGFKSYYCGKSIIYHKVSQSSNKMSDYTNYLQVRNNFWMISNNFSKIKFLVYCIIVLIYRIPMKLIKGKYKFRSTLRGIKDGLFK